MHSSFLTLHSGSSPTVHLCNRVRLKYPNRLCPCRAVEDLVQWTISHNAQGLPLPSCAAGGEAGGAGGAWGGPEAEAGGQGAVQLLGWRRQMAQALHACVPFIAVP